MSTTKKFGQKNCHAIVGEHATVFYSYTTPVVVLKNGRAYVTEQKHSVTTSRHINMFLYESGVSPVEYMTQDTIESMASGIA